MSIPAVGEFVKNMEPVFYSLEETMAEKKFRKVKKISNFKMFSH